MKKQGTQKRKATFKTIKILGALMISLLAFNQTNAQTEQKVKGVISDSYGPLSSVSIVLEDTKTGTTTNKSGEFTFPKTLKVGDVLIVSYLGYQKQNIKILENTRNINLVLTEDMIEITGALESNIPYKSKRKK